VQSDRKLRSLRGGSENGRDDITKTSNRDPLVALEGKSLDSLAIQILEQQIRRTRDADRSQRRCDFEQREPKQTRSEVAVQ
jgi:hypothetical protein